MIWLCLLEETSQLFVNLPLLLFVTLVLILIHPQWLVFINEQKKPVGGIDARIVPHKVPVQSILLQLLGNIIDLGIDIPSQWIS